MTLVILPIRTPKRAKMAFKREFIPVDCYLLILDAVDAIYKRL